jgi:hypothetical protein
MLRKQRQNRNVVIARTGHTRVMFGLPGINNNCEEDRIEQIIEQLR